MILFGLTILVALALAGLTIYQAWDKVQSDKTAERERNNAIAARLEAKQAQDKADSYFNSLQNAQAKIQSMNEASLSKSDSIIESNQKLIDAQSETLKQVNGYGFLELLIFHSDNLETRFGLHNTSNYTIRDISIEIIEFTKELRQKYKNGSFKKSDLDEKTLDHFSLPYLKSNKVQVMALPPNENEVRAFSFAIDCRHATFRQFCIIQNNPETKLNRYWYKLYQIHSDTDWQLIDQNKEINSKNTFEVEKLFDEYFVIGNYKIVQDN